MDNPTKQEIKTLSASITKNRLEKMERVLAQRTRHTTLVFEDMYQPHNVSACMRSAECFGIQEMHLIENKHKYTFNPGVSLGAHQWIDIHRYNQTAFNTPNCYAYLRKNGYRIVAASLNPDALDLNTLDFTQKTALIFGTEETGLSQYALQNADLECIVPIVGFTQSLNVSVAVAICLYHARENLKKMNMEWRLTKAESDRIRLEWLCKSIPNGKKIRKWLQKRQ